MRARLVLIPIVFAAALVAGCTTNTPEANPTPSSAPTLTDNGVAALSATEIVDKAKAALAAAKSFHAKGSGTSDGTKVEIDVRVAQKDFAGSLVVSGMTIELIRIGNDLYVKAPTEFLTPFVSAEQASMLQLVKGKFLKVDATSAQFGDLADLGDTDAMIDPEGTLTKGEAKTINGVPAIGVVDSKDSGVIYIATVGEPVPLRMETPAGDALDFTEYGAVGEIKAPATAEVIDLKSIMGS